MRGKKHIIIKALLLMILTCSVFVLSACGKKDKTEGSSTSESAERLVTPPDGIVESTNQEIINLMTLYYNALQNGDSATVASVKKDVSEEEKIRLEVKAADIESFDNILISDQPGVVSGEYIVLVYYEMKIAGIETRAPGLVATYVTPDDSGILCINNVVDEATMAYVQSYVSGDVVVDYFNQVQAAYSDAIANDPALNTYMQSIDAKLDAAVAERQQAAVEEEQTMETAEVSTVNETVTTTSRVNVRVSDSENADKLGQVEAGTTLTRYEVRENGWSKVDYNGTEGFIKSEFLRSDAPADTTSADPAVTDATQTETSTTEAPAASTGKTVEAKETVKVRASASTDAEILGLIGPDMKFSLIEEQSDGWSKIDYNGKTGYVKTEFVTIK